LDSQEKETTTAYATSLLSEASAKLVSTRDSLIKRLNDASTDTLLSASEKNLRTQLAKPFPSTPNITALKTVVDREAAALALLKKDYSAVTGEINALAREIFDTNDSQGQGGMQKGPYIPRTKLDQELLEKVRQIQNEIAVLGDEEIKELEKEKKVAKNKKLKIAQFFMGLDEDE
jgi:hypothetical protein